MLLGIVFVDFYGVIVKFLGNKYPSPQLSFFRNFFALLPIIFLLLVTKSFPDLFTKISRKFIFLCFLRGISFVLMQIFYYIAIINMNFATATTLTFSSPIFIVILSMIILREKIGFFRYFAIFAKFRARPRDPSLGYRVPFVLYHDSMYYMNTNNPASPLPP